MRSKESYEKELGRHNRIDEYEEIICPHCFHKDADPTGYSLDDDGDTEEGVECGHCKKIFNIKVQIEKTYTTVRVEVVDDDNDE